MNHPAEGDSLSPLIARVDAATKAGDLSADAARNLERWLTEPPYAPYRSRLIELVEHGDFPELDRLFWKVIEFGTGGRRGTMAEVGSATINERTIAESAHGLAVYAKHAFGKAGRAVVAHDTRNRSPEFARLTATTFAAHGFKVFFFESHRSTPELSFAVRHLGCQVGAMISASHNPPSDNGFKAYWSTGGQVLPPHDRGIVDCVYEAGDIPTCAFDRAVSDGRIEVMGEAVDRAYVDTVCRLSLSPGREVTAIYSPLHGVGETSVYRVLREAGFNGVRIFEPHRTPDGRFPNVPGQLPNPERPEVFEPIIEQATGSGADVILASDPDADRLGVSVKNGVGSFEFVTGNRVGALLADYVLGKREASGTLAPRQYVVETLVTTPLISTIARAYGVRPIDDLLVGFKYIAETMDEQGPEDFLFGAEESLGYLAGQYCRDKDAAIAALYLLELAAELRVERKTLLDRLDELYLKHGYFVEGQHSEVCRGARGLAQIQELMHAFRESPPTELAGIRLEKVRDYGRHEIRTFPGNQRLAGLEKPSGDLLFFESAGGECRISLAVRPSGTEPKIKFYLFAQAPTDGLHSLGSLKSRTDQLLDDVRREITDWVRPVLSAD